MTTSRTVALTHARLQELLHYDPETGVFTWRMRRSQRVKAGDKAGGLNSDGYIKIKIDGIYYAAHRLAWFLNYKYWPVEIDHIDTVRHHNWLDNLRESGRQGNTRNTNVRTDNKLGIKGVYVRNNKFRAEIRVLGKKIFLGTFETKEEAAAAYATAAQKYFGEFARV